jgi:hypothetical protein
MAKSKVNPDTIEKEKEVLSLRRGGLTFDLIAARVGYASASGAHKAYLKACSRIIYEDVVEVRNAEMDRLDIAQAAIWGDVTNGTDAQTRARAVLALMKIMERRARLLGLDMPTKAQVEVNLYERDTVDAEVRKLVALLNSQSQS